MLDHFLDALLEGLVLELLERNQVDGVVLVEVLLQLYFLGIEFLFQDHGQVLPTGVLDLLFLGEVGELHSHQEDVLLFDIGRVKNLIKTIFDSGTEPVLDFLQLRTVGLELLHDRLVEDCHVLLQTLHQLVVGVLDFLVDEAHVEEAAGNQQVHELHVPPLRQVQALLLLDGQEDGLEDEFSLQALQVLLFHPVPDLGVLVRDFFPLDFACEGTNPLHLLLLLPCDDDLAGIERLFQVLFISSFFRVFVAFLFDFVQVPGNPEQRGQSFRVLVEEGVVQELLPIHPLILIDYQQSLHQVDDALRWLDAFDFALIGEDVLGKDLLVHVDGLHRLVGEDSVGEFVDDDADRPNVGLQSILFLAHHFGGHGDDRPKDCAEGHFFSLSDGQHLGEAQVHDLQDPVVEHDVLGLEVPMEDVVFVHFLG